MTNRRSYGILMRLGLLLGSLGVLGMALFWQRRNIDEQNKLSEVEQKKRFPPQPHESLDQLSDNLLKTARPKAAEIASLRQLRANAVLFPELVVPVIRDAWTMQRVREDFLQYRLRELDAYRRLTNDPPEAKAAGEIFLETYLRQSVSVDGTEFDAPQVATLGRAALDAGSRDPLLRTYQARAHWIDTAEYKDAEQTWQEALRELPQTRYPRIVQAYARCFLHDAIRHRPLEFDEARKRWKLAATAIVQWLEEEAANPEWRRCACDRLWLLWRDASKPNRIILLTECLQSNTVDEYLRHVLAGDYYNDLAWALRGQKLAGDVTEQQWAQFNKYARAASDHLQYAWSLQPDFPYAPCLMIQLAMAGHGTSERPYFWFLRTVEAQFDYFDAYSAMLHSLLPRWGGSQASMLVFGRNCLGTNRFKTTVPYFVIDVLQSLQEWEHETLTANPQAIQLLRDLVANRNASRATAPDARFYEDNGAYRADLVRLLEDCNLTELTAAEIRAAGTAIYWTRLQNGGRPGRFLASRRLAAQGESQARVLAFDEKLRQPWDANSDANQLEWLAGEYQHLKGLVPADDAACKYYAHAGTILEQLRQFSGGDWVDLRFGKDLEGWEPYCDSWSTTDGSNLELSGRKREARQICLRPLASFQPPLEIEATLELLDPEPHLPGVGIGWFREGLEGTYPVFSIEAGGYVANPRVSMERRRRDFVKCTGVDHSGVRYPLPSTGEHRLRLKLWQTNAEFCVDDTIWTAPQLKEGIAPLGRLCFGANFASTPHGGAMRWSGIRLRKLSLPISPAESDSFSTRLNYWELRHAADPSGDLVAMVQLCRLRLEQGRFDEVVSRVDSLLEQHPGINGIRVWKARVLLDEQHDESAAFQELMAALAEPQEDPEVLLRLAEIRAAARDESLRIGRDAKTMAETSVRLTIRSHARSLAALAAAHAELGEFKEALDVHQESMRIASESEEKEWEPRQATYKAGVPYRLPLRPIVRPEP